MAVLLGILKRKSALLTCWVTSIARRAREYCFGFASLQHAIPYSRHAKPCATCATRPSTQALGACLRLRTAHPRMRCWNGSTQRHCLGTDEGPLPTRSGRSISKRIAVNRLVETRCRSVELRVIPHPHTLQSAFTQHINMNDCADHKANQDDNIDEEDPTNLRVVASYRPGKIEERNNANDPSNKGN